MRIDSWNIKGNSCSLCWLAINNSYEWVTIIIKLRKMPQSTLWFWGFGGFFSSSFGGKIHHPWLPVPPPISQGRSTYPFNFYWSRQSFPTQNYPKPKHPHTTRESFLAGGFNPFEKHLSNFIMSPSRDENNKCLKPPPWFPSSPNGHTVTTVCFVGIPVTPRK